ncbi:hypothetical protein GGQ73_002943 [Rhizobium skierniewicense]|uniref:ABC-three component systems C-terminal domain-containing protein n=1 Tax=Rhizobium skierniewicense TaxID=984260 RepID=A0A7W6CCL3_9HYPH|nr:ABC-three component system protein [Rhizobium skierniewicense]MBB3946979.1 hypothetical protein [Rhizobium skierniewicense]
MAGLAVKIQELDDKLLEEFIDIWLTRKATKYLRVETLGKANDKGRDVVGFCSDDLHEADWDLYQCKRKTHGAKLGMPEFLAELGKVFHHHTTGTYKTMPREFLFVAPRGVVGPVQDLLLNPSTIAPALVAGWDQYCRKSITAKVDIPLSTAVSAAIASFDFKQVDYYSAARLAKDPDANPAMSKLFNLLPGDAPEGTMPDEIAVSELTYLAQLTQVYSEFAGKPFFSTDDVLSHPEHGRHLRRQRTRFFEAAAFERFHRDNTAPGAVETFKKDIYDSVIDAYERSHSTKLDRVDAVLNHALLVPTDLRGKIARGPVRQGMCHHLASDGKLKWD